MLLENKLTYQNLIALEQSHAELVSRISPDGTFTFDDTTIQYEFVSLANAVGLPDDEQKAYKPHTLKKVVFKTLQPNLRYLDVSYCNLEELHIENCPNLQILYANNNQLNFVRFTGTFAKLEFVNLDRNQLTVMGLNAEFAPNLKYLYLYENALIDLSHLADFFAKDESDFNLEKNPIVVPPEAIVKKGKDDVRKYFADLQGGYEYLYEAKLLILGDPRAGKTTLAAKILNSAAELPGEEQTTRGIDLAKWSFLHNFTGKGEKELNVNIWDFGGQTIYKQAHRFFLTQRSFYIILSDGGSSEKTDFRYWLHSTKIFGKESPVIIFINEKENRKFDLPIETLKKSFSALKNNVGVNLKFADSTDSERYCKIIDIIKSHLVSLPHLGEKVPVNWKNIREDILIKEKNGIKILSRKEFTEICNNHHVRKEDDIKRLSQFFHDIGIYLHFQDDSLLRRHVFINKQWILEGAYTVVDNRKVEPFQGKLNHTDFENLFAPEYQDYLPEIKALLKRFYLIYEKNDFYIVPQYLPTDPIFYEWNASDNIGFVFEYEDYMPAGIFWQFLVETKNYIKNDLVWRYGVVLHDNGTEAEIIEEYGKNRIKIRVSGQLKEDFRSNIMIKFKEINDTFSNMVVKGLINCICDKCKISEKPYGFNYFDLKELERRGRETDLCRFHYIDVPIKALLQGVEFDNETKIKKMLLSENEFNKEKSMENRNIKIEVSPIITVSPNFDVKAEAVATNTVSISIEIKNFLGHTENLKEDIEDDRKLLQKHIDNDEIDATIKDIEKAEKAITELENAKQKNGELPQKSKNRLKQFIDDLADEKSSVNKTLKVLRKGKDYAMKLAEGYNKIAKEIGMNPLLEDAMKLIGIF